MHYLCFDAIFSINSAQRKQKNLLLTQEIGPTTDFSQKSCQHILCTTQLLDKVSFIFRELQNPTVICGHSRGEVVSKELVGQ